MVFFGIRKNFKFKIFIVESLKTKEFSHIDVVNLLIKSCEYLYISKQTSNPFNIS
jgi:hypothetical protein